MNGNILNQIKAELPDKSCLITIMFVPANDQQAIDLKASIDAALKDIPTIRYSFNLEQRRPSAPKTE